MRGRAKSVSSLQINNNQYKLKNKFINYSYQKNEKLLHEYYKITPIPLLTRLQGNGLQGAT